MWILDAAKQAQKKASGYVISAQEKASSLVKSVHEEASQVLHSLAYHETPVDEPIYEELQEYHAYRNRFDLDARTSEIAEILAQDAQMAALHAELVPMKLSYEEFWSRYFFRQEENKSLRHLQKERRSDASDSPRQEAPQLLTDHSNVAGPRDSFPVAHDPSETSSGYPFSDANDLSEITLEKPLITSRSIDISSTSDDAWNVPPPATCDLQEQILQLTLEKETLQGDLDNAQAQYANRLSELESFLDKAREEGYMMGESDGKAEMEKQREALRNEFLKHAEAEKARFLQLLEQAKMEEYQAGFAQAQDNVQGSLKKSQTRSMQEADLQRMEGLGNYPRGVFHDKRASEDALASALNEIERFINEVLCTLQKHERVESVAYLDSHRSICESIFAIVHQSTKNAHEASQIEVNALRQLSLDSNKEAVEERTLLEAENLQLKTKVEEQRVGVVEARRLDNVAVINSIEKDLLSLQHWIDSDGSSECQLTSLFSAELRTFQEALQRKANDVNAASNEKSKVEEVLVQKMHKLSLSHQQTVLALTKEMEMKWKKTLEEDLKTAQDALNESHAQQFNQAIESKEREIEQLHRLLQELESKSKARMTELENQLEKKDKHIEALQEQRRQSLLEHATVVESMQMKIKEAYDEGQQKSLKMETQPTSSMDPMAKEEPSDSVMARDENMNKVKEELQLWKARAVKMKKMKEDVDARVVELKRNELEAAALRKQMEVDVAEAMLAQSKEAYERGLQEGNRMVQEAERVRGFREGKATCLVEIQQLKLELDALKKERQELPPAPAPPQLQSPPPAPPAPPPLVSVASMPSPPVPNLSLPKTPQLDAPQEEAWEAALGAPRPDDWGEWE